MVEYNYLYKVLNEYGSYINGVAQGSEEWRDVTQNFAKELYQVLYHEELYMLGQIKTSATSTYILKWGNNNDFV
jgi:hypothetical protein